MRYEEPAIFSRISTEGMARSKLPMPAAHKSSIIAKPLVMPTMCGMVRLNPYKMPEVVSMMLLGPGVMEETKAKIAKGSNVFFMEC